jgi:asparagine synthase (glutamine-hydrolysing)
MCGLAGCVNVGDGFALTAAMTATMERRGPDDEGYWASPDRAIHLGFRRLSVMDTSLHGHQPMATPDGSAVLMMNGEIYNFRELRRELESAGVQFHSDGDTEVLLHLLRRHGVAGLSKVNGMFGLAYVDVAARTVLLARDQFGIKPLYYATAPSGHGVAFASRYDALFHTRWFGVDDIDLRTLACMLEFEATPAPHALHLGTGQVEPGGWMRIGPQGIEARGMWLSPDEDPARLASDRPLITDPAKAAAMVSEALEGAVRRQRVADVPVGVLLSSGVDSALVGSALRSVTTDKIDSFTMGSSWSDNDEASGAEAMARHLGFAQHTLDIAPPDIDAALEQLPGASHEPLTGRAMLPMLSVAGLAARDVVVALSGDGGDELFYGYRHSQALLQHPTLWRWPTPVRRGLTALGRRGFGSVRSGAGEHASAGEYHRHMLGRGATDRVAGLLRGAQAPDDVLDLFDYSPSLRKRDLADRVRRTELKLHLQYGLKKVDMASMHYGLEVRVPLLDREVARASFAIDPSLHVAGGFGKALLRSDLSRRTDASLLRKNKVGFAFCTQEWLTTGLRDRVEAALFDPWDCGLDTSSLQSDWTSLVDNTNRGPGARNLIWTLFSLRLWQDRVRDDLRVAASASPRWDIDLSEVTLSSAAR